MGQKDEVCKSSVAGMVDYTEQTMVSDMSKQISAKSPGNQVSTTLSELEHSCHHSACKV